MVYIIELLRAGGRTIEELARLTNVTERTIYRDIADLQGEPNFLPLVVRVMYGEMANCDRVELNVVTRTDNG
jgi:DeoR/GlpR family transcriptional regulator of sugar metabolism